MIPINIAVTGHRDLAVDEIDKYKQAVISILDKIKEDYPSSPINILTGLAEGADMLVAEIALEYGCNIIATLPFNEAEYRATFSDDLNKEKFDSLIKKAQTIIDVSKFNPNIKGNDRYAELGVYLVKNSQLIISLWDGVFNGKSGGTGDVVSIALKGLPYSKRPNHHILDMDDNIPVYHILTKRINSSQTMEDVNYIIDKDYDGYQILFSDSWSEQGINVAHEYYNTILRKIDIYNNDSKKVKEEEVNKSIGYIVNEEQQKTLSSDIQSMMREFAISDVLASKFQTRTLRLLKLLLLGGFLLFFWVTLFDEILPQITYLLLLVPVFFVFTYLIYRVSHDKDIEAKYYEYRALSESLRVQIFWKIAKLKVNTYENYPRKSEYDLGWIIFALSNLSMHTNYMILNKEKTDKYEFIYNQWINDQLNFYEKRYEETAKIIEKQKNSILVFFSLGIIFVVALFISQSYLLNVSWYDAEKGRSICLFLIDTFLAIGAVFSGYLEKRQYDSQNSQYIRMINLYTQGINEYTDALSKRDKIRLDDIIKEIGVEAICENADWVSYNRANCMDLPLGM